MAKIGFSVYYELKNIKQMLNLTVHSELEVELQVTGEPVAGELDASMKEKSHLFVSLSLLPAVWYEPKKKVAACDLSKVVNTFGVWSVEWVFW